MFTFEHSNLFTEVDLAAYILYVKWKGKNKIQDTKTYCTGFDDHQVSFNVQKAELEGFKEMKVKVLR